MKKILFLYLKAFSFTGGIEKFNSCFLKALHELSVDGFIDARAMSMYDPLVNEKYLAKKRFKGFYGNRLFFVIYALHRALKNNVLILGHINLALIGILVKKIKPNVHIILIAHGIEVWDKQTGYRSKILEQADTIFAVSSFTKQKINENNPSVILTKIKIFHNTIDPYFKLPSNFNKPNYLLERYNIKPQEQVLLTITRLSSTEKYKGYDNTIALLDKLNQQSENKINYLLCGKYDALEFKRVNELEQKFNATHYTKLVGFVKDEELIDHYLLADTFVMPSKKEGFGIVFIEALACGLKVIAGNKDGSVDALQNGNLGTLIDPDSSAELFLALQLALNEKETNNLFLQQKVMEAFGFNVYKEKLKNYLCA